MEYRRAFKLDPAHVEAMDTLEEIRKMSQAMHIPGAPTFIQVSKSGQRRVDEALSLLNKVIRPQMEANEHQKTNDEMQNRLKRTIKPMYYAFTDCVYSAKKQADAEECGERLYTQLMTRGLKTALEIANDY